MKCPIDQVRTLQVRWAANLVPPNWPGWGPLSSIRLSLPGQHLEICFHASWNVGDQASPGEERTVVLGLCCWDSPATWGSPIWGWVWFCHFPPKLRHTPAAGVSGCRGSPAWRWKAHLSPSVTLFIHLLPAGFWRWRRGLPDSVGAAQCECKARAVGARRGNRSCALLFNTLSSREPR